MVGDVAPDCKEIGPVGNVTLLPKISNVRNEEIENFLRFFFFLDDNDNDDDAPAPPKLKLTLPDDSSSTSNPSSLGAHPLLDPTVLKCPAENPPLKAPWNLVEDVSPCCCYCRILFAIFHGAPPHCFNRGDGGNLTNTAVFGY